MTELKPIESPASSIDSVIAHNERVVTAAFIHSDLVFATAMRGRNHRHTATQRFVSATSAICVASLEPIASLQRGRDNRRVARHRFPTCMVLRAVRAFPECGAIGRTFAGGRA